jgi:hypothetical protein
MGKYLFILTVMLVMVVLAGTANASIADIDVTVDADRNCITTSPGGNPPPPYTPSPLDTGLSLHPGEWLDISSSGIWNYGTNLNFGPNGDPTNIIGNGYPVAALVGRIDNNNYFFIGSNYSNQVSQSGNLYLAFNDTDCGNNWGTVSSHITISDTIPNPNTVPEPATLSLLGFGALALVFRRKKWELFFNLRRCEMRKLLLAMLFIFINFMTLKVTYAEVITLQPDSSIGKDTFVTNGGHGTEYRADYSHGDEDVLMFGGLGSDEETPRGLIAFTELPSLKPNEKVTSARLGLTIIAIDAFSPINIYQMKHDWVEGTFQDTGYPDGATWQTYDGINAWPGISGYRTTDGGGFNAQCADIVSPIGTAIIDKTNNQLEWITLDASKVEKWMTGDTPNYGMLIRGSHEENSFSTIWVASSEWPDSRYRPMLEVTLQTTPEPVPEPTSLLLLSFGLLGGGLLKRKLRK